MQTVPLPELFAILTVIQRVQAGLLRISSDSIMNVDDFHNGRVAALRSISCDLGKIVFDLFESRLGFLICIERVPGHSDREIRTEVEFCLAAREMFALMLSFRSHFGSSSLT